MGNSEKITHRLAVAVLLLFASFAAMAQPAQNAYKLDWMLSQFYPVNVDKISEVRFVVGGKVERTVSAKNEIRNIKLTDCKKDKFDVEVCYDGDKIVVGVEPFKNEQNVRNVSVCISEALRNKMQRVGKSLTDSIYRFVLPLKYEVTELLDTCEIFTKDLQECYAVANSAIGEYPYYSLAANMIIVRWFEDFLYYGGNPTEKELAMFRKSVDNVIGCCNALNIPQRAVYYADISVPIAADDEDGFMKAKNKLQVYEFAKDLRIIGAATTYANNILEKDILSNEEKDDAVFFTVKACQHLINRRRYLEARNLIDNAIERIPSKTEGLVKYRNKINEKLKNSVMASEQKADSLEKIFQTEIIEACSQIGSEYVRNRQQQYAYQYIAQAYWCNGAGNLEYEKAYIDWLVNNRSVMALPFLSERYEEIGYRSSFSNQKEKDFYLFLLRSLAHCQMDHLHFKDAKKTLGRVLNLLPDDKEAVADLQYVELNLQKNK